MPKNIFLDIDGTLMNYRSEIPDSAIFAVQTARKNGHKVILCTGRSKVKISPKLWDLGFDGLICGNGCYIEADEKIIFRKTIPLTDCTGIVDWLTERQIGFHHECSDAIYANEPFRLVLRDMMREYSGSKTEEELDRFLANSFLTKAIYGQELHRDDVDKINYVLRSEEDYKTLKAMYPNLKHGQWGGASGKKIFGDIGVANVDKSSAVRFFEEHERLSHVDSIAIGDSEPDIPMLESCTIGVAMGNSPDVVKRIANMVTDHVDQDGLAHAFMNLLLI